MKVLEKKRRVVIDDDVQTKGFGLALTSKSFEVFTTKIYTDEIMAIIRELSSNAYDSHVMAGRGDVPFDIHLPNNLEPWFSIRDYGVGLSAEQVDNVYTQFFASDKTDDNNVVGCLGLGSKSPFSYVDSFTVESWVSIQGNKLKYTHIAFINDKGLPEMGLISVEHSDEPHGVKIQIAVKDFDIHNFHRKAEEAYTYYNVLPNIVGGAIDINTPTYTIKGDGWGIRDGKYDTSVRAIMGQVAYKVSFSDENLTYEQKEMLRCPLDIHFEIGDVDIEAGREGLQYSHKTKKTIVTRVTGIINKIGDNIQEEFDKCTSVWEARCKFNTIVNMVPGIIKDRLPLDTMTYGGKAISDLSGSVNIDIPGVTLNSFSKSAWRTNAQKRETIFLSPSDDLVIYVNDLKRGGQGRCKYLAELTGKTVWMITWDDGKKKEVMDLCGMVDDSVFKSVSELDTPPKVVRKGVTRTKTTKICMYQERYGAANSWKPCDKDLGEGGFYVELNRFNVKKDGVFVHPQCIGTVITCLEKLGYPVYKVHGIKTAVLDKAMSEGTWVNLFEYAEKKLAKFRSGPFNAEQVIKDCDEFYSITRKRYYSTNMSDDLQPHVIACICKDIPTEVLKGTELYSYMENYNTLRKALIYKVTAERVRELSSVLNVDFKSAKESSCTVDVLKQKNSILNTYPLVVKLNLNKLDADELQHVAYYITAIEKKNGEEKCKQ